MIITSRSCHSTIVDGKNDVLCETHSPITFNNAGDETIGV